jgi:pyrroloquinoline quinone (PQQ) biosynthesis protein C
MPLAPRDFAAELLAETRTTHPWLHHRLFQAIHDGALTRDQLRHVIREQGAFFLDTLRHAAWKIVSVGGPMPTWDDLERQRALIPLVVEEGGHDTIGGTQTAHAYLFVRLCEGLGWSRDEVFGAAYLPTTVVEKNELFQLQREGTLEALCGGNIATESINHIASARMASALEKHYGVPRAALDFYYEHMEVEEDHGERAIRILERIARTDAEQARGRLALRRAVAVRRLCADGMYDAYVSSSVGASTAPSETSPSNRLRGQSPRSEG